METLLNPQRKINKAAAGIIAAVAILLVCAALVLGSSPDKAEPAKPMVVMEPLALPNAIAESDGNTPNGILNQRLSDLRHLQQEYNIAVTSGKDKDALETLRKSILEAEESFRTSIDSSWVSAITDTNTDSLQLKVIATYRSSLDSIRMANSSLNAATANEDFVPNRQAFIKLQDELMDKTNEIALLKSTIEVMQKQSANTRPDVENSNGNEAKIPVEIENKIAELTTGNQRLQQEIERLKKQPLEELKNNSAEQVLLSKNTALQQKVNSINAELQLVRVDCNLSRVDATQIISNSKQRKQLLSEASGILTSLSASSDADIRNKVKEKIVRLNQVAANTRD